jgi:hypothetical protein
MMYLCTEFRMPGFSISFSPSDRKRKGMFLLTLILHPAGISHSNNMFCSFHFWDPVFLLLPHPADAWCHGYKKLTQGSDGTGSNSSGILHFGRNRQTWPNSLCWAWCLKLHVQCWKRSPSCSTLECWRKIEICKIWGFHSGDYEEQSSGMWRRVDIVLPTFQRNVSPPSSG